MVRGLYAADRLQMLRTAGSEVTGDLDKRSRGCVRVCVCVCFGGGRMHLNVVPFGENG